VAEARRVGWREVLIVGAAAVAAVLAIDVVTTVVPGLRDVVFHTPLLIGVLIVATAALLWRIAVTRPPEA
jgi:hypothetical protein